jgi:hypothetical protein
MRQFFVWVAALAATSSLTAAPIAGNGSLGDFTGDFSYNAVTHTVSVTLTNAPTTAAGGVLTGFAFSLPGQPGAVTSVVYTPPGMGPGSSFTLLGGASFNNSVNVNPYGLADLGAALGGNWQGGGPSAGGLAIGDSATWTFKLVGDNAILDTLTAASIYNTLSTGGGEGARGFLVRFRSFDNGGSDKVPGGQFGNPDPPTDPDGDPDVVPEPATMVTLGLLGAMGLVGYRLRRKKA